jgi:hypothetical protein
MPAKIKAFIDLLENLGEVISLPINRETGGSFAVIPLDSPRKDSKI